MMNAQTRICPKKNKTNKLLCDFKIRKDHPIPARRGDLVLINKTKRIFRLVDFAISADHSVNIKLGEKLNRYLDLARELKKQWNMKFTMIPIVVRALENYRLMLVWKTFKWVK